MTCPCETSLNHSENWLGIASVCMYIYILHTFYSQIKKWKQPHGIIIIMYINYIYIILYIKVCDQVK